MKNPFSLVFAACFSLAFAMPAWAENATATPRTETLSSEESAELLFQTFRLTALQPLTRRLTPARGQHLQRGHLRQRLPIGG
jgi:hypothetical protein